MTEEELEETIHDRRVKYLKECEYKYYPVHISEVLKRVITSLTSKRIY